MDSYNIEVVASDIKKMKSTIVVASDIKKMKSTINLVSAASAL